MEAMNRPSSWLVPSVAHLLRIAREEAGLEQDELAVLIGVSRNSIGNYESTKYARKRKAHVITRWAMACGVVPRSIDPTLPGSDGPDTDPDQGFQHSTCMADIVPIRARRTAAPAVAVAA